MTIDHCHSHSKKKVDLDNFIIWISSSDFTTDIRHVSGDENVVADALSRIKELQSSIYYSMLARSLETDEELKKYKQGKLGLRLEKIDFRNRRNYFL